MAKQKKELSIGRKIFNGVALAALLGGLLFLGGKYGGEFSQAQALGPLETKLAEKGLPTPAMVQKNLGEGSPVGPHLEEMRRLIERERQVGTDAQMARWERDRAVKLLTENAPFTNLVVKTAESGRYETGVNYLDSDFRTNDVDGLPYMMVEVSAHAAKAKILSGEYEQAIEYGQNARKILNLLAKAPFTTTLITFAKGVETSNRYLMEALDQSRNKPEAVKVVKEILSVELERIPASKAALYELYLVRLRARDMGSDAQKYHLTISNWFGGESELEHAEIYKNISGGPKAPALVEIHVLRQLTPLVDQIVALDNDANGISRAIEQFRAGLPTDAAPGMDAILPLIFTVELEGMRALMMAQDREAMAQEIVRMMEKHGGAFPASWQFEAKPRPGRQFTYSRTGDGFSMGSVAASGDGQQYWYRFPMREVTMQMEMPAAGGGGG